MDTQGFIQDAIRHGGRSQILFVTAADLREAIRHIANDIAEQFLPPKREEKYLTVQEAASMLKVDRSTLYRWGKSDYLHTVKIGKKIRYRLSDIENIMNKNQRYGI